MIDYLPPLPGMYNGRVYKDRPIRISNGKRTFQIELNKPLYEGSEFNLSCFLLEDGRWIIKTKLTKVVGIVKVWEILEAKLEVYPNQGTALQVVTPED